MLEKAFIPAIPVKYDRNFKTEYGELYLRIPRDRNGQFQQQTIAL